MIPTPTPLPYDGSSPALNFNTPDVSLWEMGSYAIQSWNMVPELTLAIQALIVFGIVAYFITFVISRINQDTTTSE